jgi:tetratricopeptide (TPR) repeat protein
MTREVILWRGKKMKTMKNSNPEVLSHIATDAKLWVKYGDEMMTKGKFDKALEFYDRAMENSSNHTKAQALHSKANALDALGKHLDAIQCYDSALECDPNDAECWFNKGLTYKKLGRLDDGASCINKGVKIAMGCR